jgi:apolipoprotein N-acyltransferase
LTPSDKTVIFETEFGNMSGLICFDSIFDFLARGDVKSGSQLLLIGTNDSYYGNSPNPEQHNGQAVLRAVENQRYILRAGNTGISSIISPYGALIQKSEMNTQSIIYGDIAFISQKTPYTFWGEIWIVLCAAFCAAISLSNRITKKTIKDEVTRL